VIRQAFIGLSTMGISFDPDMAEPTFPEGSERPSHGAEPWLHRNLLGKVRK
jgi:hypothetical protein